MSRVVKVALVFAIASICLLDSADGIGKKKKEPDTSDSGIAQAIREKVKKELNMGTKACTAAKLKCNAAVFVQFECSNKPAKKITFAQIKESRRCSKSDATKCEELLKALCEKQKTGAEFTTDLEVKFALVSAAKSEDGGGVGETKDEDKDEAKKAGTEAGGEKKGGDTEKEPKKPEEKKKSEGEATKGEEDPKHKGR